MNCVSDRGFHQGAQITGFTSKYIGKQNRWKRLSPADINLDEKHMPDGCVVIVFDSHWRKVVGSDTHSLPVRTLEQDALVLPAP
jgi:hypothetical protein